MALFILLGILLFWVVWLVFRLAEPAYCRFIALGSDLYYAIEGKPLQFRADGTLIIFRSRSRPSFEADIDTHGITSNLVFLVTLFLATPGMNPKRRLARLGLGTFLLYLTHVGFVITKVEFSLVSVEHPLAGTSWLWRAVDNFLEVTGKAFFPILIWLPLALTYMQGEYDHRPSSKRVTGEPGRNKPCPCGSGKKYKHCCGR